MKVSKLDLLESHSSAAQAHTKRSMLLSRPCIRHALFTFIVCSLPFVGSVFGAPRLEVRDSRVVGDELRLMVETSVSHSTFASHSSTVSDVVSYAVVVNLKTNAGASSQPRVIGPLFRNPAKRSEMAYGGVDFTEQDRRARASTPRICFDDQGDVIRLTESGSVFQRERLDWESHPPRWVSASVQSLPRISRWNRINTASDRWAVDYEPEKPLLFDMRTGEQKEDPWLATALIDFRTRAKTDIGLRNAKVWLTEDLNHLVVTPLAGFINRDGSAVTFENDKRNLSVNDYGMEYLRPEPRSRTISKHLGMDGMVHEVVRGVFMIRNEPFLLYGNDGVVNLATFNGETRFHASVLNFIPGRSHPPKSPNPKLSESDWQKMVNVFAFSKVVHQPEAERMVFVVHHPEQFTPRISFVEGAVDVIIWHYPDGGVRFQRVNLKECFRAGFGKYQARQAEAIGN